VIFLISKAACFYSGIQTRPAFELRAGQPFRDSERSVRIKSATFLRFFNILRECHRASAKREKARKTCRPLHHYFFAWCVQQTTIGNFNGLVGILIRLNICK
jgi:hypothetical protein